MDAFVTREEQSQASCNVGGNVGGPAMYGDMGDLYQNAVDVQYKERNLLSERVLEKVEYGNKHTYFVEKVMEVPQVITKQYEREVPKPEIIERIIEVPKPEIRERLVWGPPQ